MMFSFSTVQASELEFVEIESTEIQPMEMVLKLEDAILMAQKRDKRLRIQQTTIELAEVTTESAKENYYNSWDIGFEQASSNYSQAQANEKYEKKNESIIGEGIAYSMEKQFDTILELEDQHKLAKQSLDIQSEKTRQSLRKQQLGLSSEVATKAEQAKLDLKNKEMESLTQAIDTEYRKLNDVIGGEEERYSLIKENLYRPLEMERSIEGQISYAINSDPGFELQEEMAKAQEISLIAPNPGPMGGAPTYAVYQQRKLSQEQAVSNISLSKEGKEQQIKQIYENILALEIQHDTLLIELEETKRQYEIMLKRYELGMVTNLNLQELELAILQKNTQISSTIRQHNQLKILFDKSYLGQVQ